MIFEHPLLRKLAGLNFVEDRFHGLANVVVDHAVAAGQVAVLGGFAHELVHFRDAAFVDQIDNQLQLVQAFEISRFGLIARFTRVSHPA